MGLILWWETGFPIAARRISYLTMWFIELERDRRANDRRLPSVDRELPISAILAVDVPPPPPSRQFNSAKLRWKGERRTRHGPLRRPSRAVADGERTPRAASLGRPAVSVKCLPRYRVGVRLCGLDLVRASNEHRKRWPSTAGTSTVETRPSSVFAKPIGGYRFPHGAQNGQRRRSNAFRLIIATRSLSAERLPAGTRSAVGSGSTNRYRGSQLGQFVRATVCRAHHRLLIVISAAITASHCSPSINCILRY